MKVCLSSVFVSITIHTDYASVLIKALLGARGTKRRRALTGEAHRDRHVSTLPPPPTVSHFPAHIPMLQPY